MLGVTDSKQNDNFEIWERLLYVLIFKENFAKVQMFLLQIWGLHPPASSKQVYVQQTNNLWI